LNPSSHHWENERKLSLSREWRTSGWMDGQRTGRTSPYHNASRFQRVFKKNSSSFWVKDSWAGRKTVYNIHMKWPRYRRLIRVEIQVGITSQINKWANTDHRKYWRWDQVPRGSKHPLPTGHTRRDNTFIIYS
jgi:hypothetical protein